jgi:hypothetical protein
MDLLNVGFAILVTEVALSVLPAIVGIYLIFCKVEQKRKIKQTVCRTIFGSSNVFRTSGFSRFLVFVGILMIAFSGLFGWFFIISKMI